MIPIADRYLFAAKVVRLVEDIQRFRHGGSFFGGVNWNYAIVNGLTDSLESMILGDAIGNSKAIEETPEDLMQTVRTRIQALFESHRELVAELELSGMRYGEEKK